METEKSPPAKRFSRGKLKLQLLLPNKRIGGDEAPTSPKSAKGSVEPPTPKSAKVKHESETTEVSGSHSARPPLVIKKETKPARPSIVRKKTKDLTVPDIESMGPLRITLVVDVISAIRLLVEEIEIICDIFYVPLKEKKIISDRIVGDICEYRRVE